MKIKGKQPHRRLARENAPVEWLDAMEVRRRLRMSRAAFARTFGLSVSTVRQWEMRTRRPRGAALILMHVIWRQPRPVLQAVAQAWRAQLDGHTIAKEEDDVT
jgi:DNA-binding transcriptional regulator YiaG